MKKSEGILWMLLAPLSKKIFELGPEEGRKILDKWKEEITETSQMNAGALFGEKYLGMDVSEYVEILTGFIFEDQEGCDLNSYIITLRKLLYNLGEIE